MGGCDLGPGALAEAEHVSRLADVLESVSDHTHQSHSYRYRGVPALVDDPIQLGLFELGEEPGDLVLNIFVVAGQLFTASLHLADLLGRVTVPGVGWSQRQSEGFHPLSTGPDLFDTRDLGDMVVHHPGQVPDEPGDRVRRRVRAVEEIFRFGPLQNPQHLLTDPSERVRQNLVDLDLGPPACSRR